MSVLSAPTVRRCAEPTLLLMALGAATVLLGTPALAVQTSGAQGSVEHPPATHLVTLPGWTSLRRRVHAVKVPRAVSLQFG